MVRTWNEVDPLVRFFCCDPQGGRFGPYTLLEGQEESQYRTELLPGSVWRYRVVDEAGQPVDLHVCAGLGDSVGLLWDLEVRALLRIGAYNVPGLPEVLGGGYIGSDEIDPVMAGVDGLAVVATRAADHTFADDDVASHVGRDAALAMRILIQLAEALAALHAEGMFHGDLWPGAIYVRANSGARDADVQCWIAGFEMASLLANHVRVNNGTLTPGEDARRYAAPELRAGAMAPTPGHVARGDVYSLAVIAAEWFAGLEEPLADADQWAAVLLAGTPKVPAVLIRLLVEMLAAAPEDRPTAAEIVRRLHDIEHVVAAPRETTSGQKPHLVFYLPEATGQALRKRGWIVTPPNTPEGRREIGSLITADLAGGQLLYSPQGAAPFVSGDLKATSEARYVLLGDRAAWFCALYRERDAFGRSRPPRHEALMVKYFAPLERLEAQLWESPRLQLPVVETRALDVAQPVRESALINRPNWMPLLESLVSPITADDELFDEAIVWLLRYQSMLLRARYYACTLVEGGRRVEVITDQDRDDQWIRRDPLLSRYASLPRNRPGLGDFLVDLDNDGPALLELVGDFAGRPAPAEHRSLWFTEHSTGPDRVALRPADPENRPPPTHCWIRPADDIAAAAQLRSQAAAIDELRHMPLLRAQLRRPQSRRLELGRWQSAGASLPGESAAAVEEMLAYDPFYALQGPPGAGKTTIAAKAVAAWLRTNPQGRVLVSAQSNVALDALAERILAELGELDDGIRPTERGAVLAWRPTGANDDRVSPALRNWTGPQLVDRAIRHAHAAVSNTLATSLEPDLRVVLGGWRRMLDDPRIVPELTDRLTRSANLVFATCAMSRPSVVSEHRERDLFDWVVIEEAARAWPTELAIPLTRAARWTLIGDHRQLPAYGRDQLDRFLDLLESDPLAEAAMPVGRRRAYARVFDLFESLFDTDSGPAAPERPVRRLTVQYRMARPISQLVGEAFYPIPDPDGGPPSSGLLYGGPPRISSVNTPEALAGRSLVWINTHGRPDCRDEPAWANPGEAALVARLVESITPPLVSTASEMAFDQLAVLAPYRKHLELLLRWPTLSSRAWTVHSFQGREAEIVIVSLVRDTRRGPEGHDQDRPWLSLGHLSQPQLVNVLLSRARSLLVLVGDFEHFARYQQTVWTRICRTVQEQGAIVPADDLFGPEEG